MCAARDRLLPLVLALALGLVAGGCLRDIDPPEAAPEQTHHDWDGDGYCEEEPCPAGSQGDCDDENPWVFPDADEVCDGIDNNCDGALLEDEVDADGDGYFLCQSGGRAPDCDDSDPDVHPGATEACNGVDDDCDGEMTGGETDADGDGWMVCEQDCDDDDPATYPAADEVCDGADNDCDGVADAPFDADGDGYTTCGADGTVGTTDDDCDDTDGDVHPGVLVDSCDGADSDCNGHVDDGDADGDGTTACDDCDDTDASADMADHDGDGITSCEGDCDDLDAGVYPDAPDVCDGVDDNDCDGVTDALENDDDGDGHSECDGDCDDTRDTVSPDAIEICDGVLDNDCDGTADPLETDDDGDGATECDGAFDCDDTNAAVYSGAPEVCDGVDDNDCDGVVDVQERDADGDGVSVCDGDCDDADANHSSLDLDGDGYSSCDGDCDDADWTVYPGAYEQCDGVDNDCDNTTEEGIDDDGDGYSECQGDCDDVLASMAPVDADGDGYTICGGDCDDTDITTSPDGLEVCDGVDNDCDGQIDDDCTVCAYRFPDIYYNTIQEMLSNFGGTLLCVDPGDYTENIYFAGRDVRLVSVGGPQVTRLFELSGTNPVVRIQSGEGAGATVEGFTISGGNGGNEGGGIFVSGSSPTLTRLIVEYNNAARGGGIHVVSGDPVVEDVIVRHNDADAGGGIYVLDGSPQITHLTLDGNAADMGGGIYVAGTSAPELDNVLIHDNTGTTDGGGVFVDAGADMVLQHAWIVSNDAPEGGGLRLRSAAATVNNAVISGNFASDYGGGVGCETSDLILTHSTLVDNTAGLYGGGIILASSTATLNGVVLSGGVAGAADGGGGVYATGSTYSVTYCDVWDNQPDDYGNMSVAIGVNGNRDDQPLFLDTASNDPLDWDVHLEGSSPLIDQGDYNLTDPDGTASDMGAYSGPGAGQWDLDGDGYFLWWMPGPYNVVDYGAQLWDCDDGDAQVYPGHGC